MADSLEPGDKVSWHSSDGESEGEVVKKITSETKIKGHAVKASSENPELIVKSDSSGNEAAHKPDALEHT